MPQVVEVFFTNITYSILHRRPVANIDALLALATFAAFGRMANQKKEAAFSDSLFIKSNCRNLTT